MSRNKKDEDSMKFYAIKNGEIHKEFPSNQEASLWLRDNPDSGASLQSKAAWDRLNPANESVDAKTLIESDKSTEDIISEISESMFTEPSETAFAIKYLKQSRGMSFHWTAGRKEGMSFYPSQIEDGEHVRGAYENHPQFGNISSDIQEIYDLVSGIEQGVVNVERNGSSITGEAMRYVDLYYQETEG